MLFPILSSIPKAVLKSTKDLMFFFLDRERCCPTLLQMQSFTNTHGCFDGENFSWSIPSISTFSTWMSAFSQFNSSLIYNYLWRGAFFSFISIPLSKKIEDAAKYLDPRLYLTSTLLVLFNWWSVRNQRRSQIMVGQIVVQALLDLVQQNVIDNNRLIASVQNQGKSFVEQIELMALS